jgi:hypothetical protein
MMESWVVGPYPEDLQTSYSPQKNPDPGPGVAAEESAPQAPLVWQSPPADAQGFVDLGALFGHAEHISAYVYRRVYSPKKQQAALLCGSDDFIRVWLNGKQIHEHLRPRIATPTDDCVLATLEPGWNTLLARVVNVRGNHALYWRLSNTPAAMARARGKTQRPSPGRP